MVQLLKIRGANFDARTPDGRSPAELTKNFHVRAAMALHTTYRQRHVPTLDKEEEDSLNGLAADDVFKNAVETPRELKEVDTWRVKSKKLSSDDQEVCT